MNTEDEKPTTNEEATGSEQAEMVGFRFWHVQFIALCRHEAFNGDCCHVQSVVEGVELDIRIIKYWRVVIVQPNSVQPAYVFSMLHISGFCLSLLTTGEKLNVFYSA